MERQYVEMFDCFYILFFVEGCMALWEKNVQTESEMCEYCGKGGSRLWQKMV